MIFRAAACEPANVTGRGRKTRDRTSDLEPRLIGDWSVPGPWLLVAPGIASDLAGLADEHLVTTIPHVDKQSPDPWSVAHDHGSGVRSLFKTAAIGHSAN